MKPTLPTNYKDDILNTSVEGSRRYQMIYNSDNTVSFKDVTPYDQTGSDFGAGDINLTNEAVNQSADAGKIIDDPDTAEATTEEGYIAGVQLFNHVNDSLTANDGLQFQFAYDSESNKYGYMKKEADTEVFVPFSNIIEELITRGFSNGATGLNVYQNFNAEIGKKYLVISVRTSPTSASNAGVSSGATIENILVDNVASYQNKARTWIAIVKATETTVTFLGTGNVCFYMPLD